MKKIFKIIVALTLCLAFIPLAEVNAVGVVEDNISLDEILSKKATVQEVKQVGEQIAEEKNNLSSNCRMSGEAYTLIGSKKLYARRGIKGKYKTMVDSYTNKSYSVTVSLANVFTYRPTSKSQISVNGGISKTETRTLMGPTNEYLSNGKLATHRLFIGITFGEIYQYTFKVTDKYSGHYLRTETKNAVVGAETYGLTQLMCVNSNGTITVGNSNNNRVKTYSSLSSYKAVLEKYSYDCKNVIYF